VNEINKTRVDILLVEQDVNLALEIAHRAYFIETEKIVMEGKSQDFIADDYVRESYLGI